MTAGSRGTTRSDGLVPPFVGRRDELRVLKDGLQSVSRDSRARLVSVIGQGGIASAKDALEFIIAGATAVGVGTALFYDPLLCRKINDGIADYLQRHKMKSLSELVGSLRL